MRARRAGPGLVVATRLGVYSCYPFLLKFSIEVLMFKLMLVCAASGLLAMAAALPAQGPPAQNPPELKVGDTAPAFALQGSDGKVHKLSDHKGKTVVLAWFPKAFTGG